MNTIDNLPRPMDKSAIVPLKLKRKMEYKGDPALFIRPYAPYAAVLKLKELGNPFYENINIFNKRKLRLYCEVNSPKTWLVNQQSKKLIRWSSETLGDGAHTGSLKVCLCLLHLFVYNFGKLYTIFDLFLTSFFFL